MSNTIPHRKAGFALCGYNDAIKKIYEQSDTACSFSEPNHAKSLGTQIKRKANDNNTSIVIIKDFKLFCQDERPVLVINKLVNCAHNQYLTIIILINEIDLTDELLKIDGFIINEYSEIVLLKK